MPRRSFVVSSVLSGTRLERCLFCRLYQRGLYTRRPNKPHQQLRFDDVVVDVSCAAIRWSLALVDTSAKSCTEPPEPVVFVSRLRVSPTVAASETSARQEVHRAVRPTSRQTLDSAARDRLQVSPPLADGQSGIVHRQQCHRKRANLGTILEPSVGVLVNRLFQIVLPHVASGHLCEFHDGTTGAIGARILRRKHFEYLATAAVREGRLCQPSRPILRLNVEQLCGRVPNRGLRLPDSPL